MGFFNRKRREVQAMATVDALDRFWALATTPTVAARDEATEILRQLSGDDLEAAAILYGSYAESRGLDVDDLWPEPLPPGIGLPTDTDIARDWDRITRAVKDRTGLSVGHLRWIDGRWRALPLPVRVMELAQTVRPTDGERIDAMLRKQGEMLIAFNPFGRSATAAAYDELTDNVRRYVAGFLGVRPWEITVRLWMRDGQVEHVVIDQCPTLGSAEKRLKTARELVLGLPRGSSGWKVADNPTRQRLVLSYGRPEKLPDLVPLADVLPDALRPDEWSELPVGMGPTGEPVCIDLAAGPHGLTVGPTGSGKLQPLDSTVPVPVSERFPDGWARWGDLNPGDFLYAPDGSTITALHFTEPTEETVWEVELDDGQIIECAGSHAWVVADANARCSRGQRDHWAAVEKNSAEAERIRNIARNLPPGSASTASELVQMVGSHAIHRWVREWGLLSEEVTVEVPQQSSTYIRNVQHWLAADVRRLGFETAAEDGEWVPTPGNSKRERKPIREALQAAGVECRIMPATITRTAGVGQHTLTFYPTDEALMRWADHLEGRTGTFAHTQVRTTEELAKKLTAPNGGSNWSIETPVAIDGPYTALPIDPYVLGAWLGDGSSHHGSFSQSFHGDATGSDSWALREELHRRGYVTRVHSDVLTFGVLGLKNQLRDLGLIQNKHIPARYLRASYSQRLDVLRGLMDTDGTIDVNGNCELALSDERLATDALELIRSLGIKASMTVGTSGYRDKDGNRVRCKDRHRIHFTTTVEVFTLERKLDRLPLTTRATTKRLYIKDVRKTNRTTAMRCVYVDHPEHMYLTNGFVPTHNTVLLLVWVAQALMRGHEVIIVDPTKAGLDFATIRPWTVAWADTLPLAQSTMERVYEEVTRRKKVLQQYGEVKWSDLNPQVRRSERIHPTTVILDEYGSLVLEEPVPKGLGKDHPYVVEANERNAARSIIASITGRVAREARFVGIHLSIGLQRPDAAIISGEMRANLTSGVQLSAPGKPPSREALTMLFPGETAVHVDETIRALDDGRSRGLGVIAADGGQAKGMRVAYAPAREIPDLLEERGVPQPEPWTGIKNPAAEPDEKAVEFNPFGDSPDTFNEPQTIVDSGFSLDDYSAPETAAPDLSHLVVGTEQTTPPADELWD